MSDYKDPALILEALPKARTLLGDRGYDADWFRAALADRKIAACTLQDEPACANPA